jgi:hypothetical protein
MRRSQKGMTGQEVSSRPELRAADDATIEDAIAHADPMVLRGLVYQLTGGPEVATGVKTVLAGYFDVATPAEEADVALLRRKGAEFLKAYRHSGAGDTLPTWRSPDGRRRRQPRRAADLALARRPPGQRPFHDPCG